jgi:ribonuclease HI
MQTNISSFFSKGITTCPRVDSSNKSAARPHKISSTPCEYVLFFDGCSKHNPGPSGAGAVLYQNGEEIWSRSLFVGRKETNNVAEYMGMIIGVEEANARGIRRLLVKGDSNLVVQQMNGKFQVKAPGLRKLYARARNCILSFESIAFEHVYRNHNQRADELANLGLLQMNR